MNTLFDIDHTTSANDSPPDYVRELACAIEQAGLSMYVRECSPTHLQVLSALRTPFVNVWPTTRKYLAVKPQPGEKAKVGSIEDVVTYAIEIMNRQN